MKRQPTEWKNIFANDICDNGLMSKTYIELVKGNDKNTNNLIKNGQRPWIDTSPKSIYRQSIDI